MELKKFSISIKYASLISVSLIVGFVICFLAKLGYLPRFTYSDNKRKIEVQATNSNFLQNS